MAPLETSDALMASFHLLLQHLLTHVSVWWLLAAAFAVTAPLGASDAGMAFFRSAYAAVADMCQ